MLDKQRIIAEVAARNGIRIETNDPLFAVMTVTQLALEDAANELTENMRELISEFETNVRAVERRAGKVVAQEARDRGAELKRELRTDVEAAGAKASEIVKRIHNSHQRPNVVMWASIGLLCAVALFCSGVWFGRITAGP
ncbi:MAG: hypothetical protein ACR2NN_18005 [Bryobacteraceae bacterium]